ncbi:metallophosphoesterase [Oscillospiraceae bacterium 42-9]|jgi:predicted phosphodiesterase
MRDLTAAVLADVHGNYRALQACLDYAQARRADQYLFLGDYITDHPYPQRVMALLYAAQDRLPCRFIRGNREDYMIHYRQNGGRDSAGVPWKNGSPQGALLHCYENLTSRDVDWFESLPISGLWQPQGAPPIAYCHGSPEQTRDEMRGDRRSLEMLGNTPAELLVKGHNHRHWMLAHRGKRLVCAGSVGNAIDRRAKPGPPVRTSLAKMAQMAFLHLKQGRWQVEYVRVPYDWQGALEDLKTSGLYQRAPVWAAMLRYNILTGCDPFNTLPTRAAALYAQETGLPAPWSAVPEAYWERAAAEFHVSTIF